MSRDFWKSSGYHLLTPAADGGLQVTADYLRAYYTRPEIHPIEESCAGEHALFEVLMADPFCAVSDAQLTAIKDGDAEANYRLVLAFRDLLCRHGSLEAAYRSLFTGADITLPPLFIDQLVHVILRHILQDCDDPLRLRAAELLFREQQVSTSDDRIIFADAEIIESFATSGGFGGLGQLLSEAGTPTRQVSLDVMDGENKDLYWPRSDRFDTAIDLRFTQPALDALARVLEAWLDHFLALKTRIQPQQAVTDGHWSWHVGLDRQATDLLNRLYQGDDVAAAAQSRLIALFRLEILDAERVIETMAGKPVYLGLAMDDAQKVKVKPQNLLTALPLKSLQ